ncbi:MAG: SIMPL domain-containing protein [Bacteroides sp.]|nr:SIMPL domain-containing protein [Prevotella sp.]MCM1408263.1 SIMPL domain-containing protein [Treponema brennaborense]MCM1470505.1 SIMPL domain-containing protein [Bacteroides sp.]
MKNKKLFSAFFLSAAVISAFSALSCTAGSGARTVTAAGSGSVSVLPDVAVIKLSVITRNVSVKEASAENTRLMTQVQQAIQAAGIAPESFSTSNYRIYQENAYSSAKNTSEPYRVSNMLTIILKDIAKTGAVIDTAIAAGANELSSLDFSVLDAQSAAQEARILAVKQAEENARQLAENAGAKLGRIVTISEENYTQPLYQSNVRLMATDTGAGTPVSAGKSDITVSVRCIYELK